jgi:hypothetical protein
MTFARPAAFPGGRVLAGWWKQLSTWQPQTLWIGTIGLERVEALCSIHQNEPLPPLDGMLLRSLDCTIPDDTSVLDRRWGIGPELLSRLLTRLEGKGIVRRTGQGWTLTEAGDQARHNSVLPGLRSERRPFWFLSDVEDGVSRTFVVPATSAVFQPIESGQINRHSLEALIKSSERDAAWKRARGFPLEIASILAPETASGSSGQVDWEKIVVVHPYRLQAALITYRRNTGDVGLAAFSYLEHGWSLAAFPIFDVAAPWEEAFPGLPITPSDADLADAWRKWLAQRGMVGAASDKHRIEPRAGKINVIQPAESRDILGGPRGDLARGEAWLILGDSSLRRAIIMEPEPSAPTPG